MSLTRIAPPKVRRVPRAKGAKIMKLNELSRDQIRELKENVLYIRSGRTADEETKDIDSLVSEQDLYEEYGDREFEDWEFACTAPF